MRVYGIIRWRALTFHFTAWYLLPLQDLVYCPKSDWTMFGSLVFTLTTLAYIVLAIFNLQRTGASGERMVGWGFIALGIVAVYVVLSLVLTISVTSKGGFNWLSETPSTRNILVGVLWIGMVTGVVFCTMIRSELQTDRTTGLIRTLSMPVYFGAVWLPLLMLIPYAILLHPSWRDSLSPGLYKVPLVAACLLGFVIVMIPRMVTSIGIKVPKKSDEEIMRADVTEAVQKETSVKNLLEYGRDEYPWMREMAFERIKALPQWEEGMIEILSRTDEYGPYGYYRVYDFMDQNKVEHPEKFVAPINNTLPVISLHVQGAMAKSFLYTGDLSILHIDEVCRVMDQQFKDSRSVFTPNMLKLKEALETSPANPEEMSPDFAALLKQYQDAVQAWLDENGK